MGIESRYRSEMGLQQGTSPESSAAEPDAMLDGTNESLKRVSANDFKKWKMRTPTWKQMKTDWEQDCQAAIESGIQAPPFRETAEQTAQIHEDIHELMQGRDPQRDLSRTLDGPYSSSPEYSQTPWHDSKPLGLAGLTQERSQEWSQKRYQNQSQRSQKREQNRYQAQHQRTQLESSAYEADAESLNDESTSSSKHSLSPGEDELDIDDDYDTSYEYYVVRESWFEDQTTTYSTTFGPFVYLEEANAQLCSAIFKPLKKMRIETGIQGTFEQEPDGRIKWVIQAGHMYISAAIMRKQIASPKGSVNDEPEYTYLVHMSTEDHMAAQDDDFLALRSPNSKVISSFTRRSAANVFAHREILKWIKARTLSEVVIERESEFEIIERNLRVYYLDLKKQNLNDAGEDDGFETRIDVAPRIGLFDRQFELDSGRWIRIWVEEIELRGPRN